jgi:hypothetical protein
MADARPAPTFAVLLGADSPQLWPFLLPGDPPALEDEEDDE